MNINQIYKYNFGFLFVKVIGKGDGFDEMKNWDVKILEGEKYFTEFFGTETNLLESTIENLFTFVPVQ